MMKREIMMKKIATAATVLAGLSGTGVACTIDSSLPQQVYGVTAHASDHHSVYSEIIINAAPKEVWDTLISSENDWSSSFRGLTGDIKDGGDVVVLWQMKNGNMTEFPLKLINFEEGVQFGWSEEFPNAKGIFDNHLYRVEAISECQTRFVQTDAFKGTSAQNPDAKTVNFAEQVLPGYVSFNNQLKAAAEQ